MRFSFRLQKGFFWINMRDHISAAGLLACLLVCLLACLLAHLLDRLFAFFLACLLSDPKGLTEYLDLAEKAASRSHS